MIDSEKKRAVIVGGGFFGASIALMLHHRGVTPIILEESSKMFSHASRVNQARVHGGYHYPRSLLTAYRSRRNYDRFKTRYQAAIADGFTKIYAVGRRFSKVTANQFDTFMKRVGAPLREAPQHINKLFNHHLTERIWIAEECAFDYAILRDLVSLELNVAGIETHFSTSASKVTREGNKMLVHTSAGTELPCDYVFNATYAGLNRLPASSNLPLIPLKHELAEMALIELPPELRDLSVTMMCGPFFSFMPYPALNLTTLSHVRYTPHAHWFENNETGATNPYLLLEAMEKKTAFEMMVSDAARYIPVLRDSQYRESLWTIKTLLPLSENDDGRPILFQRDLKMPGLVHVMGGKIDNIFDVEDEIENLLTSANRS
jgi:glycine/D-amino acid oxidase-like deaminating enzyme